MWISDSRPTLFLFSFLIVGPCFICPCLLAHRLKQIPSVSVSAYLHQVRSYGRSFSSTYLWAPSPEVDFSDCQGLNLDQNMPMNEAPFMWTYTDGAKVREKEREEEEEDEEN